MTFDGKEEWSAMVRDIPVPKVRTFGMTRLEQMRYELDDMERQEILDAMLRASRKPGATWKDVWSAALDGIVIRHLARWIQGQETPAW